MGAFVTEPDLRNVKFRAGAPGRRKRLQGMITSRAVMSWSFLERTIHVFGARA
jgi:hypothetical protein